MLDPESVDLRSLAEALEDHDDMTAWYLHRGTGEVVPRLRISEFGPAEDIDDEDLHAIEPAGSRTGYRDMADFVAGVQQRRAADLLERAITGRGAFRRFKDTLTEFPDLREGWFRFRDARAARRALRWLAAEGLVDPPAAERAMARHPDPVAGPVDLLSAVTADLGLLLGDRLLEIRTVTDTDDGLALVIVLAGLHDPWDDLRVLDDLLWRHTLESGRTVTALPVGAGDLAAPATAVLRRAAGGMLA